MKKLLNGFIILVIATTYTSSVLGDVGNSGGENHHHMFGEFGPGGMIMGPLFTLLWIVLLVAAIVTLLKWMGVIKNHSDANNSSALTILEERYARGEIDKRQFDSMRGQLSK